MIKRSYIVDYIVAAPNKTNTSVKKLLNGGIIRESKSKYASSVVLTQNKDGLCRLCIEYRKLNSITVQQPYLILRIDELIDYSLGESKIFSAIDMTTGYHQLKIFEKYKDKTAFITPDGLFEFNRLPLGPINASYTLQRIMNFIFKDMLYKIIVIYLDDILIYSNAEENHKKHLDLVFRRCRDYNININWKKSVFFKHRLTYLGFALENGKMDIDELQKRKIKKLVIPKKIKELRQLLGVLRFFKRFIRNYAIKVNILQEKLKKGTFKMDNKEKEAIENIRKEFLKAKIRNFLISRKSLLFILMHRITP